MANSPFNYDRTQRHLARLRRADAPTDCGASMNNSGYCIFIDTVFEGRVPLYHDGDGKPVVYTTRVEAEREIVEDVMTRLQEFLDGQRAFDDAVTVEEYVLDVDVYPDGAVVDADGNCFQPPVR